MKKIQGFQYKADEKKNTEEYNKDKNKTLSRQQ